MRTWLCAVFLFVLAPGAMADDKDKDDKDPGRGAQHRRGHRGTWSVGGGISPGDDYFAAALSVGYGFTPALGTEMRLHYQSLDQKINSGVEQGGSLAFIVRAMNPTMVTPFIGAGPGYETWKRSADSKTFDKNSAATATGFAGATISIGGSLGIQIQRRNLRYLQRTPLSWGDHTVHESKSRYSTEIGFVVSF